MLQGTQINPSGYNGSSGYRSLCPPHTRVWWAYWFHRNSIFVEDLYQDFNVWTVLIKWMDWLPSLLIMLIILKSRSERKEFSWLQRLRFVSRLKADVIKWFQWRLSVHPSVNLVCMFCNHKTHILWGHGDALCELSSQTKNWRYLTYFHCAPSPTCICVMSNIPTL
jgi:hypothetical protein